MTNSIPSNRVLYLLWIPRNTKLNFGTMCKSLFSVGAKRRKGKNEERPPPSRTRWQACEF